MIGAGKLRPAAFLLVAAGLVLLAGCTRAGARAWTFLIEDHSPSLHQQQLSYAQAIVVLGGNRDRVHEAARVHELTGLPILVSGRGTGDWPYEAESEKMAAILRTQHGIEPRWVETRSVNTHENAVESRCLLRVEQVDRIVLVTGSQHMRRARHEFRRVGFSVLSDPVVEMPPTPPVALRDFVPSLAGARLVAGALGEVRDLIFGVFVDAMGGPDRCGAGATPG